MNTFTPNREAFVARVTTSKPLTWEDKLAIIQRVSPMASLHMRRPGDWYVCSSMQHAHGQTLMVGDYGNGPTPRAAVESHWREYTDGRACLVNGQWYVWNGRDWLKTQDPRS